MHIVRLLLRLSFSPWLQLMALLGLVALAVVSLVPAEHSPPGTQLPGQIEHFIAYACVSALAAFAFQRTIQIWLLTAAFIGYAAILEYAQQWFPGHSPSIVDFLGSSAGALAGIGLCLVVMNGMARLDQIAGRR